MKAHKEATSPNYALTMSRSFRSLSLLAPKRLKDRLDVTMHLQHDGNWKCSITGLPSWLIANRFLYTYCCLHFDSTLNGKFCEYSHGRCTFLKNWKFNWIRNVELENFLETHQNWLVGSTHKHSSTSTPCLYLLSSFTIVSHVLWTVCPRFGWINLLRLWHNPLSSASNRTAKLSIKSSPKRCSYFSKLSDVMKSLG